MDNSAFRLNEPQVVADTIDDEVLAINMATGAYFNLKGWSAYVWTLLTTGNSIATTRQHLAELIDGIDEATLASFANELAGHGLLAPVGDRDTSPNATATAGPAGTTGTTGTALTPPTGPFQGLAVEAHTDMADLILLDPVHDVDAEHGWPAPPQP